MRQNDEGGEGGEIFVFQVSRGERWESQWLKSGICFRRSGAELGD